MISQYANSPKFVSLVTGLRAIFDISGTLEDWYNFVFNLKTASGFGLDIWGGILNQDRYLTYFNDDTNKTEKVFLKGEQTIDGVLYTAEQIESLYRLVLFLRAMSYISNSSIAKLNELLRFYFQDRGLAYVLEYGTMKIRFVFQFFVNKLEKSIFESEIMPKPTGVLTSYEYIPVGDYFGFFVDGKTPTQQPYAPADQKPFYW